MNPTLFLLVLRARFGLFALALGVTVASAAAASLMLPKSYRATASLVVDQRDSQSLSDALNVFVSPAERTAYLQTQVEIIESPAVARKVVDALKLAERPSMQESFAATRSEGTIEDWIAEHLPRGLGVETSQSSVMHVNFDASDPADAAAVANGFARAYMDMTLELHVEPTRHAAEWFDEQLKTLRGDLELAQEKLTAYQRTHGIVSADERLDEEYAMLSDLSEQLTRALEENVGLATREQLARQAIAAGTPLENIPGIRQDSGVQEVATELRKGEAALQALAVRYGENHPDYRRQRAENRYLRGILNTEMRQVAGLASDLRLEGEQRATRMGEALEAQRARLLELKESRDGLAVLMRNVNTAQTAYDTAMQRFVVNRVESRASHANATLLNPAAVPRRPHRPNLVLNLALAGIVGVLLGLGLVMTREMTDRRVHSSLELPEATGAPILGELVAWTPSARLALPPPQGATGARTARGDQQDHS